MLALCQSSCRPDIQYNPKMTDPAPLQPAPLPVPQGLGLLVPQAETFLVEGLYIGLLSRHQPPTEVREWFDDNRVCEMLKAHVKRKNKSTVYLTAIVLCMAGKLDGVAAAGVS